MKKIIIVKRICIVMLFLSFFSIMLTCLSTGKGEKEETIASILAEMDMIIPDDFYSLTSETSGGILSANNSVISLLYLESGIVKEVKIRETCSLLGRIITAVREKIKTGTEPEKILQQTRAVLREDFGLIYREEKAMNLVSVSLPAKQYDHDTGVFIFLAIAEELSWPISLVRIPNQYIIRWNNSGESFNFDIINGTVLSDDDIRELYGKKGKKFPEGMYLKNMVPGEIVGVFYNTRAIFYFHTFDYLAAKQDFDRAVEYVPGLAVVYNNRANTCTSLEQYQSAFADYELAIRLNPFCSTCYKNRGELYMALKKYTDAVSDFAAAIELSPKEADLYYLRGVAYFSVNEYVKAEDDLTQALQLNHDHVMALIYRGMTYFQKGKIQKALKDFKQAVKLEPKSIMYVPDTLKGKVRKGK
jgi:tetratricopeptide (TPR) repeat protein